MVHTTSASSRRTPGVYDGNQAMTAPAYLEEMKDRFDEDPHGANLEWFRNARFGLFLTWGLHAAYGGGCRYFVRHDISVADYKRTMAQFTAERFDADFITDLALEAQMRYVTFVTRHQDSFSLWDSRTDAFSADYCSTAAAAKRDFVAELAEQCAKKGLALFLYYSYAMDWLHPWYPTVDSGILWNRRRIDGYHRWQKDEDTRRYIDFAHGQIAELLTGYGPIAGMWFDPVACIYQRPDLFPVEETYALVRDLQPGCLIAFKNGATGTEDFIAPEGEIYDRPIKRWIDEGSAPIEYRRKVRLFWDDMVTSGCRELCSKMESNGWGYVADTERVDADEVMHRLADAAGRGFNLLLNTGPLFDGSIHPDAVATLKEVGRRIQADGWPGGN